MKSFKSTTKNAIFAINPSKTYSPEQIRGLKMVSLGTNNSWGHAAHLSLVFTPTILYCLKKKKKYCFHMAFVSETFEVNESSRQFQW